MLSVIKANIYPPVYRVQGSRSDGTATVGYVHARALLSPSKLRRAVPDLALTNDDWRAWSRTTHRKPIRTVPALYGQLVIDALRVAPLDRCGRLSRDCGRCCCLESIFVLGPGGPALIAAVAVALEAFHAQSPQGARHATRCAPTTIVAPAPPRP